MIYAMSLALTLFSACPESQRIAVHEPSMRRFDGVTRWTGPGAWVEVRGDTLRICQCGNP